MTVFGSAAQKIEPTPMEAPPSKDLSQAISTGTQLVIKQKRELAELFLGFETRNQYMVFDQNGAPCGSIAEQGTGVKAFFKRMFLKSRRPFVIHVTDASGKVILEFSRPFFFLFSDITVRVPNGPILGSAHRRYEIINNKKYELRDANGAKFAELKGGILRLWTFAIRDKEGNEVARISKKWSGLLKEYFTDADNFMIEFGNKNWTPQQRAVIFATAISVDFDFFEYTNK